MRITVEIMITYDIYSILLLGAALPSSHHCLLSLSFTPFSLSWVISKLLVFNGYFHGKIVGILVSLQM